MTDPSYKETMEFVDSLFINWNKLVAKKHGVTSTASRLFELGDFMHDVMKETLTQKMKADKQACVIQNGRQWQTSQSYSIWK